MSIVAYIPVRMGSTRFPGKPLAPILGISMVEHVFQRTRLCNALDDVCVVTPDDEIREAVEARRLDAGETFIGDELLEWLEDRDLDGIAEAARLFNTVQTEGYGPEFRGEDLSRHDFRGEDLAGATFKDVDLSRADFGNA